MNFEIKSNKLFQDGGQVAYIQTPNGGTQITPKYVVIHYTAGDSLEGAVNWFKRADAKASAHIVLGLDGKIVQMQPFNKSTWHAGQSKWDGISGLNNHSIGIEVVNPGALTILDSKKDGYGKYKTWYNKVYDTNEHPEIVEMAHRAGGPVAGWLPFSDVQIAVLLPLVSALMSKYDMVECVGHDMISPGRKQDPGPTLNDSFYGFVNGRTDTDAIFEVFNTGSEGLNVRTGPGPGYTRLFVAKDGTKVEKLKTQGDWTYVEEADVPKRQGWVNKNWLRRL